MHGEVPKDLKPVTELALDYRIPFPTLRRWQRSGKLGEWTQAGRFMASEGELRAYLAPRRTERDGEQGTGN